MIYFDDDTRFAVREFDLMKSGKLNHKGLVQLHEAYMVRKYLILILDFVEGKTLLDQFKRKAISLLQSALDEMEETDARLLEEESEDYVEASFVFRTFEEDEYE